MNAIDSPAVGAALRAASRGWVWPLAVALAAAIGPLLVSWPALSQGSFTLDDGWITQVIARNFAQTGVWGFERGRPSASATSLLWALLVTPAHLLGVSPVTWAVVWSVAAIAAACAGLYAVLACDGFPPPAAAGLALLPSAFGNTAWLASTGLEASLIALLSILSVLCYQRRSRWTGFACGLLALTRLEGVGLALIIALLEARRRRSWRAALPVLLPAGLALALTVAVSLGTAGTLLPTTLAGRRWLAGATTPHWQDLSRIFHDWAEHLVVASWGWPKRIWVFIIVAVLFVAGLLRACSRQSALVLLVGWNFALLVVYAVVLPSIGHGGRYQPLMLFLAPVLVALGLAGFLDLLSRGRHPLLSGIAAVVLILATCAPTIVRWRGITTEAVAEIQGVHGQLAAWLKTNLPPGVAVAAFDIGMLGYFSARPIVDLGGLVDHDFLPYLREGRTAEYLRERRISYVVLPVGYNGGVSDPLNFGVLLRLFGAPGLQFECLARYKAPLYSWQTVYAAIGHFVPMHAVYRLRYTPEPDRP